MKKLFVGVFALILIAAAFLGKGVIPVHKDTKAIAAGEKIYRQHCLACHGQTGKGEGTKVGTAINNQQFLGTVTNRDLYEYVKSGRNGTDMPAYRTILSEKDLNQLVTFIRSWQTDQIKFAAPKTISGNIERGEKQYNLYCLNCHGEAGTGKLKMGTALSNPQYLKFTSNKQIWISTAYGREGTRMGPSLKGLDGVRQLKKEDIMDIVSYIRSLEKKK
ncbi:c-type cytochrome [Bacillus salipaludis]|uniref:C-type cytochrome n=1 Tax=Bacillus salipaludis TaxID=2547811 RepID=A0A4R5VNZ1_9BACI|nr:c-type cytochrome [Bacillus salipaludis]MDQ6599615.1 c-type cytochrome [Bacillus salipaludis]TDK60118.1 c-type cytochrome [Bacillus salipaludis]